MSGIGRTFMLATRSGGDSGEYVPTPADIENVRITRYMGWTWAAIVGICLFYRWTLYLLQHIRQLANVNHGTTSDSRQRYFSIPDERWAWFKRHILSAPLLKRRHNREFKLSAAINVGTLPSRFQMFFLVGYLTMNAVFCAMTIDWSNKETIFDEGRNRTGVLSVMNMVPLFLLAGRNNPLIYLLGVSFDTYNLIHRWIGRIVVLEAFAHSCFWVAGKVVVGSYGTQGWGAVLPSMAHSQLLLTGTIATCAFLALLFHSPSVIRHAFYETFLHLHIAFAIVGVATVWIHLNGLPQQTFVLGALVLWVLERFARIVSICRHNIGRSGTKAEIEALPGDAVRITLRVANPWRFRPGQHIYLYMPSVGMWTSHPFSLAWSDDASADHSAEKALGLPMQRQDILASKVSTMSLIVRRRTGFTDTMFTRAERSPAGKFTTNAWVEGPYGSQDLSSYGTVLLFAAGVGITHQVPHVRHLVASYANGTCATRKVVLVWIIQSPEHLEWIRPWMTQILGMEKRREVLKILLFVTRPRSTKEIHSPSSSVQMFPGKPDCGALVEKEQASQVGAMGVSVCGTGGLSDDVRKACRERMEITEIDFFEEAFSW